MSQLVVLTCASGKQCSHIVPLLLTHERISLRLIVHSEKSIHRLKNQWPKVEVIRASLENPSDCAQILHGATTVYYISPTFQPNELQLAYNVIEAAVKERAKPGSSLSHLILSSVLHPEISKLLNHDRKRLIEEHLCESSLPYTVLQPSHFADNAINRLLSQVESDAPVFVAAHDPAITFSFSTLRDHAEVSVKVILEGSKHFYATYQVVSTKPMTYTEYVQSVGKVLGKTFEIRQMSYEQAVGTYCKLVFDSETDIKQNLRDGPERLLLYYNRRGIVGNPNVLEWLLGRPGTSPAELARSLLDSKVASTSQNG